MKSKDWKELIVVGCVLGLVLPLSAAEKHEPAANPKDKAAQTQQHTASGRRVIEQRLRRAGTPIPLGKYWIGVTCGPVDPIVQSQLGLKDNEGVVINDLVDGSPAAKAGLQKYDILLKVGKTDLIGLQPLVDAVQKAGTSPLEIKLLRKGKEQTVTVTPTERDLQPPAGWMPPNRDLDIVRKYFDRQGWPRQWQDPNGLWMRFYGRPFHLLPGQPNQWPENLRITIEKKGSEPAQIRVERNGKKWEVTENELEKLPPDIRPHVESYLGWPRLQPWSPGTNLNPPEFPAMPLTPLAPNRNKERMEQQLEKALKQIEQLNRSMEELRRRLPEQKEKKTAKPTTPA